MGTLVLSLPAMPGPPTLRPLDEPLGPQTASFFSFFGRNSNNSSNSSSSSAAADTLPLTLPFNFAVPGRTPPTFTFELVTKRPDRPANPLKRRRRLTDVDGDGTAALLRKKRRLLKTLITSRLSIPYSYPATNIADRGTNKAALWARIRRTRMSSVVAANLHIGGVDAEGLGPEPMLRKAAILNRMRLLGVRSSNPKELILSARAVAAAPLKDQLRSQEMGGEATRATDEPFVETTEVLRVQSPNMVGGSSMPYTPLAPSPLGFSNYDALDLEDEWPDDDEYDDEDGGKGGGGGYDGVDGTGGQRRDSIYSDFSVFDQSVGDDDDDDDNACNTLGFSAMPHH